ncbi:MAG: TolC family protein [Bacteroidaceae bacterium]|nr:TolC family protein [Bacteroidaceae bacterium]
MKRILFIIIMLCVAVYGNAQRIINLDECLKMARENNITLKNAALSILAAREQKSEVYTKYFPQIQANVMAIHTFGAFMQGGDAIRTYTAAISATMPLYAGGQITTGNKLAELNTDVVSLQRDIQESDVLQKVTECYWQIAKVKYNLNTISAAEKQVDEVERQVENMVKAGITTRNDLLRVQIRKQELASNRLQLENAQHILRMLLAQQIGCAGEDIDISATDTETVINPDEVHVSVLDAVNVRNELSLAAKGVEASRLQIRQERGKLLPTIGVGVTGFNYGIGGLPDVLGYYVKTNATNGLALGSLSVPITAWWGGTHAIKRRKMALQQSRNVLQQTREQLAIDIESAWSSLQESYKQIEIARTGVAQAEENLRISMNAYRVGTETLTNLLDAETLNRKMQDGLSAAIADYQVKMSDYIRKTR